ncbi:MAG: T9SS type A sorting domain-containing protein [Cyclobacteriaceae bacterium]|nr:T9SS type A sorting domain-containing protein [Cyclobacteriaceae bacterium]MDW8330978.1 two-component regulator propeller domain-containing protein [Cyclobacteriaceae bacterium]
MPKFYAAFYLISFSTVAQQLEVGSWYVHPSFNRIPALAQLNNQTYAAAANGLFIAHPDGEIEKITLPTLSRAGIRTIASDGAQNQLLIGYEDGQLDILKNKNVFRYSRIRNATEITGSKTIHHINIKNTTAYLASDFGVVVFDLTQREIRETWRNLGPAGEQRKVFQSALKGDSIFIATENGIQGGNLNDNLLDFTRWKRFNQGLFNRTFTTLVSFNGFLFTAIPSDGIYRYDGTAWIRQGYLTNENSYRLFASADYLYVIAGNRMFRISSSNEVVEIISDLFNQPLCVLETPSGLRVGDSRNGLLSGNGTTWMKTLPNGPSFDVPLRLRHNTGRIYAVSGGYTVSFTPAGTEQPVNQIESGTWSPITDWLNRDVTDVAFSGNKSVVGSFSDGLQVITPAENRIFNSGNSPITGNRVTALATSGNVVWVANYNATQSLHRLNPDNSFTSFSFPPLASRFPLDLVVDGAGQVWMRLNPTTGGGILVFNPTTNNHVYLTEAAGTGGLPSRNVYALTVDRNGWVWVGTDAGVAYFSNPGGVFSGNVNAVKPIFEGRFLLREEKVTAIAIDGGNRKWFGTERGLWLFDATVTQQLNYFTTANAPLPSDRIQHIVFDDAGNAFMATDKGLVTYRSDASEPQNRLSSIKIFPNPVPETFTGWVGISGLTEESTVRITDLAGRLIWQSKSNGGTAAWNVRDYGGQRPPTGIYLVFAITADGKETLVGKLALIN